MDDKAPLDKKEIHEMFDGIDDFSREILARKNRGLLLNCIDKLGSVIKRVGRSQIVPPLGMIFRAFALTPLGKVRVVLVGQDPFINKGEAVGLSFSVPRGVAVPPSTKNIYACLLNHKLITAAPEHGDLTAWAKQGVLMLNCALTTELKKSNAHADIWREYTDQIIREISALPQKIIFILFGSFAQKKASLIDPRHVILTWGHPSPLNAQNRHDGPGHFKYCDVFVRVNSILEHPINWDPDALGIRGVTQDDPRPPCQDTSATGSPSRKLWIFCDGSGGNGHPGCIATYGYYMTDGLICAEKSGPAEGAASNNRGELTAIKFALEFLHDNAHLFSFDSVVLVTDSKYSMNCLDKWYEKWKRTGRVKKNLDLIGSAYDTLRRLRDKFPVEFRHCYSHRDEPPRDSLDWFIWRGNYIADSLCTRAAKIQESLQIQGD